MFKLTPNPTFPCTVQLHVPGIGAQPLDLVFRHKGKAEFIALVKNADNAARDDADFLNELIFGWEMTDTAEKAAEPTKVEYSKDALKTFLNNYPTAAAEIIKAYQKELLEARLKN